MTLEHDDVFGFPSTRYSLESFETGTSGAEWEDHNQGINNLVDSANAINAIRLSLLENNTVSRQTAVSIESISPGILPEHAPVASYTLAETGANLTITVESILDWSKKTLVDIIRRLGEFFAMAGKWLVKKGKELWDWLTGCTRVAENAEKTFAATQDILAIVNENGGFEESNQKKIDAATTKARLAVAETYTLFTSLLAENSDNRATVGLESLRDLIPLVTSKIATMMDQYAAGITQSMTSAGLGEANSIISRIADFKPDTLVEFKPFIDLLNIHHPNTDVGVSGEQLVNECVLVIKQLNSKHVTLPITASDPDIIGSFLCMTTQYTKVTDSLLGQGQSYDAKEVDIPKLAVSGSLKNAPDEIAGVVGAGASVLNECVEVLRALMILRATVVGIVQRVVASLWNAAKTLMAEYSMVAKAQGFRDAVSDIEKRLRGSLVRA